MPDQARVPADGIDRRRPPRVDALAGGPVVYPGDVRERLVRLCGTDMPTYRICRALDEMLTDRMVRGDLPGYWAEIEHSGVDILSVSIGAWGDPMFGLDAGLYDLDQWDRRFGAVPRLLRIEQPDDLRKAVLEGRTGILLGFQNSEQFEGDLGNVTRLALRGVRMVQLTYNGHNAAGSGCTDPRDDGLTRFGRDLVRELNEAGVIIDVSHCGPRTSLEAIEWSSAPVAVSHAGCAALCAHDRNKPDDLLRLLGDRGGFFGVCAVPFFLREDGRAGIGDMIRHIGHAMEVAGPGAVGIGSDWGVPDTPPQLLKRLQGSAARQGFRPEHGFDFAALTLGFESWGSGWGVLAQQTHRQFGDGIACGLLGANFTAFFGRVSGLAGCSR